MQTQEESSVTKVYDLADLNRKQRQLNGIYSACLAKSSAVGSSSPRVDRFHLSMGFVALECLVMLFVGFFVGCSDPGWFILFSEYLTLAATIIYPLATWSSVPATYLEIIDQLLAEYDPVDKHAYWELQRATRAAGLMNVAAVLNWARAEDRAVEVARRMATNPSLYNFLRGRP